MKSFFIQKKSVDYNWIASYNGLATYLATYSSAKKILKRVIDLSADYRLSNIKIYEKFYKTKHGDESNLKKAVYGLPEIYRAKIKKANIFCQRKVN